MVPLLVFLINLVKFANSEKLSKVLNRHLKLALFYKCTTVGHILLPLYVDDMIITGYLLSQSKYIVDIFEHARFIDNKTVDTPLKLNTLYFSSDGSPLSDLSLYRTIVGSLVYLTLTSPNIAHVVHIVKLRGYCDVDWASDPTNRQSTTGFCIFLGDSLSPRKSKKQDTVSRSSIETEYPALASTICEMWSMRGPNILILIVMSLDIIISSNELFVTIEDQKKCFSGQIPALDREG
ncbi:uncharacterized protein LOC111405468 [Olea europaea var. sylvestris]|uniref:uncharacterized protein LOC111405468 n=1 Tax=Olea europaea var. sylvestris TaxID=158386 RepID=UPI000C1D62C0|nr:uncharacterized protein LOC111405468 [Olea europaea var. sylvestris]